MLNQMCVCVSLCMRVLDRSFLMDHFLWMLSFRQGNDWPQTHALRNGNKRLQLPPKAGVAVLLNFVESLFQ